MLRTAILIAVTALSATATAVYNYQAVAGGQAPVTAVATGTAGSIADPDAVKPAEAGPDAVALKPVDTPAATADPAMSSTTPPLPDPVAAPVAAAIDIIVPPVKRVMPKPAVASGALKPVAKGLAKDAKPAPAAAAVKQAATKSKPKKLSENEKGGKQVNRD